MLPISQFPLEARRAVRGVFCDIDDTLTTGGRLTAPAYSGIERLMKAGLMVVPITGRPAGWCDLIARQWPVSAVVGENGAFFFRYDAARRAMQRRFVDDGPARAVYRARLAAIGEEILRTVPGAALAADQLYRETDLAIDYCEDVARLPRESVDRIVAVMEQHGLTAKVSSIHVNGWFGTYDKLTMARVLMREAFGVDLDLARAAYVFVGDSPNDSPLFAHFPHSVGVANIRDFEGQLAQGPAYVTRERGGSGFHEVVECLLSARNST